jgi:ribose transport system substrate-binding protein
MDEKARDLMEAYRRHKMSRREFIGTGLKLGLSLPAINVFLAACAAAAEEEAPAEAPAEEAPAEEAPAEEAVEEVAEEAPAMEVCEYTPPERPDWLPIDETMVDASPFKTDPPYKVAYADASVTNSWRVMAKGNWDYAVGELYKDVVEPMYTDANDSLPKQISDVEDLITKGAQAIILAAVDVEALNPTIKKTVDLGIPVIILERLVTSPDYTVFIDTDNAMLGVIHMEYVCQKLCGKGNIVIIGGIPGSGATVDILNSYDKVLEKYPDVNVLGTDYGYYARDKGREVMENFLTAFDQIDGVAAISGNHGLGVYEAVEAAGRVDEVKAWVGDDTNGWMKVVCTEELPAVTVPLPTYCIVDAVEVAVKLLSGEDVPRNWYVELPDITEENICDFANFDRPDDWWWQRDLPDEWDPMV